MNHDQATRYFDALGDAVPDRRPPTPELVAAGQAVARRRARRIMVLAAASIVLVVGGGAVAREVAATDEAVPVDAPLHHTGLTDEQFAVAVRVAETYADKEDAEVTLATATWTRGTVTKSNTGDTCDSGELLHLMVAGSFPRIVTSGGPPGGDPGPVTAVLLTADAVSEDVCFIGVRTGPVTRDPDATVLFGSPRPVRLVGSGRVVVAVPDSWAEDDGCGPTVDALLNVREQGSPDDGSCGAVPSLAILDADSQLGRALSRYPLEDRVISDLNVRVGDSCLPTAACIYAFGEVVVVPEADVVLLVSGGSDEDISLVGQIVGSLRLLPDRNGDVLGSIGNDTLRVGETAELTVYTHCGLHYATIDGTLWETDPRGRGSAPDGADDPFMVGRATRLAEDHVEFSDREFGEVLAFRPSPPGTTLPGCF